MTLTLANGQPFEIPMFDPVVAGHFGNPASYGATLLHQINEERIYDRLFRNSGAVLGEQRLTFLDIGANAGLVSLYAAPVCARIVALEPAPETFSVLRAMTHGFPQIEAIQAALAPVDGDVEFFVNDVNSTASSTVNTYGTRTMVRGMTLTSILSIHQLERVDVCKCDAEGAEGESLTFDVLEKAAPIIKSYYCEMHNCPKSTWEEKMGRIVRDLSRLGYYHQRIEGMTLFAAK